MKLLIIAGPHEADRIRRAAVAAGVEAAAIEPGQGLSGWITATRPDLIILASHIVSADPNVALAKVRSVPRGRVPIFLVGDADEEARLRDLADGFFVRPLAPDVLLSRAREVVARMALRSRDDAPSGPHAAGSPGGQVGSGPHAAPPSVSGSVAAVVASPTDDSGVRSTPPPDDARSDSGDGESSARLSAPTPARAPTLKPLVAARPEPDLFAALADDIDADFDAEIRDVVRAVGALRQARSASRSDTAVSSGLAVGQSGEDDDSAVESVGDDAVDSAPDELKDETSQKTLEVPLTVSAALIETDRDPATENDPEADHRALVLARYASVMAGDYFQILGISRDAAAADIQEAYERAMTELSTEALHPAVTTGLSAEINETRVLVTEAARLLMDDRLREQYRQHLPPLVSSSPSPSPAPSPSEMSTLTPAPAPMFTPADAEGAGS